jgi:hypothetical protein
MFAYQEFDPCSTTDKKSLGHELLDAETNEIRLSNAKARLQEKKSKDKYKDRVKVPQQASIPSKFEEAIAYGARP